MMAGVGKLLTHRNRLYLLVPCLILNLLAPLLASLGHPQVLMAIAIFAVVASAILVFYIFWLSKRDSIWARVFVFCAGAFLTGWDILIFLPVLPNIYFGMVIVVQLIFLLLGPRYGLAMLGLVVLASAIYQLVNPAADIPTAMFSVTVQATVGLLSWIFVSAANDMTHNAEQSARQAHEAMSEAQRLAAEVTKLNKMLISSQDDERRRLARDIHDGPLQSLGVELLAVERAKRRLEAGDYEKAAKELEYLRELARDNVTDLRDTVNMLRNSLLDSGIEPALQNLARKTQATTGTNVEVSIHLGEQQVLPDSLAACIYQLAVEALSNIKKHARADNATLSLEGTQEEVVLRISDDGHGLDYEDAMNQATIHGHIGLYSMKERVEEFGGTMSVVSVPEHGTTLRFTFPRPFRLTTSTRLSGPLV